MDWDSMRKGDAAQEVDGSDAPHAACPAPCDLADDGASKTLAVSGQYLKYATLSWRQISEDPTPITGGITVAFTLHTAWKREFFNRNAAQEPWGGCRTCTGFGATTADCGDADAPCVLANVGDLVEIYDSVDISTASIPQVSTVFSFGGPPEDSLNGRRDAADIKKFTPVCRQTPAENGRKCIPGRVIESYPNVTGAEIMPAMDALSTVYVVTELVYKYPSVTRTYSASFQGCCRMKAGDRLLNNNAVGAWDIRATVSVTASRQVLETGTAASPYFAFVPTVNVIKGRPKQFQVFAYDTADRPITYAIGTADEQGVGLNLASQGPYVSQGQYDNVMGVTIDAGTGMVTFPATASTVYERFYSLVITASVIGPCASYNFEATPPICLDELGTSVLTSIKTAVDFYIQVDLHPNYTIHTPQSKPRTRKPKVPQPKPKPHLDLSQSTKAKLHLDLPQNMNLGAWRV